MLYLRQHIRYFETCFENTKDFNYRFYLFTRLTEEAHVKIYCLEIGFISTFLDIFHEYLTQSHYLTGVGSCTYKEENLTLEVLYLKR